ncbi:MAG: DUF2461 domain-containing protein [Clostridiales bacterium]|nr:DUF2461 domain-containing protein [Clostridiales bacterium]
MNSIFKGFPKEMPQFLYELQFKNTVESKQDNIVPYKELITKPLYDLYEEIVPVILDIDQRLDTKRARCASSPYRDRRIYKDIPLKDYMYLKFRQLGLEENAPVLYFDMGCDNYTFGLRVYWQSIKHMELIRKKIAENTKTFNTVLSKLIKQGFKISGERYKRDRWKEMSDCPAKELYNCKRLIISKDKPLNEGVFNGDLSKEIIEGYLQLRDMLSLIM